MNIYFVTSQGLRFVLFLTFHDLCNDKAKNDDLYVCMSVYLSVCGRSVSTINENKIRYNLINLQRLERVFCLLSLICGANFTGLWNSVDEYCFVLLFWYDPKFYFLNEEKTLPLPKCSYAMRFRTRHKEIIHESSKVR